MVNDIKISVVTYEEFSEYTFEPLATFFVVDAMQNYVYFHTAKRQLAQEKCDSMYGKGKYIVKASKMQKTKSKLEGGGYSAR